MKRNEGTPIKRGLPEGVPSADKSGELEFYWVDDEGKQGSERQSIRVA